MFKERLVQVGHVLAGGAVNEHRVENIHSRHLVAQAFHTAWAACLKRFPVVHIIHPVAVERGVMSAGNAHDVQFKAAFAHEFLALRGNLFQEFCAHGAHAAHKEVEHLVFAQEEAVVYNIQGLAQQ